MLNSTWRHAWRGLLAGVLSLGLAACGGGGGGGGGGSDAKMTVSSVTGAQSSAYELERVTDIVAQLRITSGAESLAGKTLYLRATLPDAQLFDPVPFVSLHSDGQGATLQLIGTTAPVGERVYSGTLTIEACLDAECRDPLSVTNNRIDYRIEVTPGLRLSASEVTLQADFGVVPDPQEVLVTLPAGTRDWEVKPVYTANFDVFDVVRDSAGGEPRIRIAVKSLGQPDTELEEIGQVRATLADGTVLSRGLRMRQVNGPANGRRWAFQRPALRFDVPADGRITGDYLDASAMFVHNDSPAFTYEGTSYVEWPAAAETSPRRDEWLLADRPRENSSGFHPLDVYDIRLSVLPCVNFQCLPAGTYRAVEHYRYAPAGLPVETIEREVVMVIAAP